MTMRSPTAFHEAAHAVIGRVSGLSPVSVRLFSGRNGNFGQWTHRWISDLSLLARIARDQSQKTHVAPHTIYLGVQVVISLAGIIAETRFLTAEPLGQKQVGRALSFFSNSQDHNDIEKYLKDMSDSGEERCRLFKDLGILCKELVNDNWPQIDAVAQSLLADGKIVKRKDLLRIIGRRKVPLRRIVERVSSIIAAAAQDRADRKRAA